MKKLIMITTAAALTLAMGTTVLASSPLHSLRHATSCAANAGYCNFTDEDNDGICDYKDTLCSNAPDANHNGICDYRDTRYSNTSDAKRNGVCSYRHTWCSNASDADSNNGCDNSCSRHWHGDTACTDELSHRSAGEHQTRHHGQGHH